MKQIPKHIKTKLKRIEQSQMLIKKLVSEVEEWANVAYTTVDYESNWTWAMFIDMQGEYYTAKESEELLKQAMKMRRGN